jgi:hypothetical protein
MRRIKVRKHKRKTKNGFTTIRNHLRQLKDPTKRKSYFKGKTYPETTLDMGWYDLYITRTNLVGGYTYYKVKAIRKIDGKNLLKGFSNFPAGSIDELLGEVEERVERYTLESPEKIEETMHCEYCGSIIKPYQTKKDLLPISKYGDLKKTSGKGRKPVLHKNLGITHYFCAKKCKLNWIYEK